MSEQEALVTTKKKKRGRVSYFLTDILAYALFMACLATLIYQGYQWITKGHWHGISLFSALQQFSWFMEWEWVHSPDSMFGLHRIITYIMNFEIAAFFALAAAAVFSIGLRDKR